MFGALAHGDDFDLCLAIGLREHCHYKPLGLWIAPETERVDAPKVLANNPASRR